MLACRWIQAGPGRVARLVAGSVIAAGLLAFIQVYPSIPSSFGTAARQAQSEAGTKLLRVEVPDAQRFPVFVAALPPDTEIVTVEPDAPATLRGSCPALKALDLPCTPVTVDPRRHPGPASSWRSRRSRDRRRGPRPEHPGRDPAFRPCDLPGMRPDGQPPHLRLGSGLDGPGPALPGRPLAAGFAIWLTAPLTTPPRRGVLPPELFTAATLLVLAVLTAA